MKVAGVILPLQLVHKMLIKEWHCKSNKLFLLNERSGSLIDQFARVFIWLYRFKCIWLHFLLRQSSWRWNAPSSGVRAGLQHFQFGRPLRLQIGATTGRLLRAHTRSTPTHLSCPLLRPMAVPPRTPFSCCSHGRLLDSSEATTTAEHSILIFCPSPPSCFQRRSDLGSVWPRGVAFMLLHLVDCYLLVLPPNFGIGIFCCDISRVFILHAIYNIWKYYVLAICRINDSLLSWEFCLGLCLAQSFSSLIDSSGPTQWDP